MTKRNTIRITAIIGAAMISALFYFMFPDPALGQTIEPESDAPYDRAAQYGGWIDADGDCVNTRHEVLALESLAPVVWSDNGCRVLRGLWFDLYTGKTFVDPGRLDIDHVVPLMEAHQSGAWAWTQEQRVRFVNDLDNPGHLIAVSASANRSKGARDPADWMPPLQEARCVYAAAWLSVKEAYNLSIDPAEEQAFRHLIVECGDG